MEKTKSSRPRLNNDEEKHDKIISGKCAPDTASIRDALDIANKKIAEYEKTIAEYEKTVGQFLCFKAWLKYLLKD